MFLYKTCVTNLPIQSYHQSIPRGNQTRVFKFTTKYDETL